MSKKPHKTLYCKYHGKCDRPENCFDGESCPFFETQFYNSTGEIINCEKVAEEAFDKIWNGET